MRDLMVYAELWDMLVLRISDEIQLLEIDKTQAKELNNRDEFIVFGTMQKTLKDLLEAMDNMEKGETK